MDIDVLYVILKLVYSATVLMRLNSFSGPPKTLNNLETRDTEKTQAGGMR